jgi:hypothetical protein
MGDVEWITLGDYGTLRNLDEVVQGFQPTNPVVFDIKNIILAALKENQFSGKESEDSNAHLKYFLEAFSNINDAGVSEFKKKLCLFVYSLNCWVKDWLNV